MTTIAIVPDNPKNSSACFRAVSGEKQSTGATAGQALDALREQLGKPDQTTLIVIQPMQPDKLFSKAQQQRLAELLTRWRTTRDAGTLLPSEEQAELDALVEAELRAACQRSAALAGQLPS